MPHPLLVLPALCLSLVSDPGLPVEVASPLPALLDLSARDTAALVPRDARDPMQVEAARKAWEPLLAPYRSAAALRVKLPRDGNRVALLLGASQALKAQNAACRLYVAYDAEAPAIWEETAWGAVEGGILTAEDLGGEPDRWTAALVRAQEQFAGRPWTLFLPTDPGARLGALLGDGGRLVVPAGGPAERLARQLPGSLRDVEGGMGDLTVANAATGEARRWTFQGGEWRVGELRRERTVVAVTAKDTYDVGALLAKMRATQLRDRSAVRSVEAHLDINLHFQGEKGSGDLGMSFRSFEKAGETEELLRKEVRLNGVAAKLHGEVQLPLVEARTGMAAPVALSLTERYRYSDGGVAGPGLRRLRFEPVDKDPLLYEGEVLVEEATGRIREERSRRSGMPGIVRSEDRTLLYGEPVPGHWRVVSIRTFERWMGSGGVGQIQRNLDYRDFRFNDAGFEAAREAARTSDGAILKQTLEGYRYFVKQGDGTRKVEERARTSGRAVGGVLLFEPNGNPPVLPLAGLLFFDFNAFNRGIQYSLLTAGVFNHASATIPQVFAGVDLSLGTTLSLLKGTERPVKDGKLLNRDGVDRRSQAVEAGLGRDLGAGFRLEVKGQGIHDTFTEAKDEAYRTPGFLIPRGGWTGVGTARLSFQARGFQSYGFYAEGRRPSGSYGAPGQVQEVPDGGRFARWGGWAGMDRELGRGLRASLGAGYATGRGFDRFQSLDFAGRVDGFRSHAVVADRMAYANADLIIPTGPNLRLTLGLDHGRARGMDDGKVHQFTGMRVAGDLPGFWWFTSVRTDLGIGLHSDIQGVKAVQGAISFLRLF